MKNILKLLKKINEIHKNFIKKFVIFSLLMGILPLFSIIAPKLIIDEIYGQKRLKIIFIIAFLVLIFDLIRGLVNLSLIHIFCKSFYSTDSNYSCKNCYNNSYYNWIKINNILKSICYWICLHKGYT